MRIYTFLTDFQCNQSPPSLPNPLMQQPHNHQPINPPTLAPVTTHSLPVTHLALLFDLSAPCWNYLTASSQMSMHLQCLVQSQHWHNIPCDAPKVPNSQWQRTSHDGPNVLTAHTSNFPRTTSLLFTNTHQTTFFTTNYSNLHTLHKTYDMQPYTYGLQPSGVDIGPFSPSLDLQHLQCITITPCNSTTPRSPLCQCAPFLEPYLLQWPPAATTLCAYNCASTACLQFYTRMNLQ